jgi:hypothetical protein
VELHLQADLDPSCAEELREPSAEHPSFEEQPLAERPSAARQTQALLPVADPSAERRMLALLPAVLPWAVHQMQVLLPAVDPSMEQPSEVHPWEARRTKAPHPFAEAPPSLELQMLEQQRVAVRVSRAAPTEISSDCRPALPRKNRHHHRPPWAAAALHIHPCRLATQVEAARGHPDSSSVEMDIPHSSQEVLEAHKHPNHLHQPLEAAALHLRRPRTRHTYCRACPCP